MHSPLIKGCVHTSTEFKLNTLPLSTLLFPLNSYVVLIRHQIKTRFMPGSISKRSAIYSACYIGFLVFLRAC